MNEQDFSLRWNEERPMYDVWGAFVVSEITSALENSGRDLASFLKQPVKHRVKEESSLIDKAFYRDKNYENPFDDIEDKVGCRFVVLLVEHIDEITEIITNKRDKWSFKECRHFSNEREKEPLLFTYQSVHYVVRASENFSYEDVTIQRGTPCEVQIRTLLQHAYAELTHDAVYKTKALVKPSVHRTVAKSMALIETTDDFFSTVNQSLNDGNVESLSFQEQIDELYNSYIGLNSTPAQKSSIVILDAFEYLIDENTLDTIRVFLDKYEEIAILVRQGRDRSPFYSQSIVLVLYWLIKRKRTHIRNEWPLDRKIIETLAADIGVSFEDFA